MAKSKDKDIVNKGGHPIEWIGERKDNAIKIILERISNGESVRSILDHADRNILPSWVTFNEWLNEDEKLVKQYARAKEVYADSEFERIDQIAMKRHEDHTPFTGINVIQRDKLIIDSIKWRLSKLNPKKYGDKVDVTSGGEKIQTTVIKWGDNEIKI